MTTADLLASDAVRVLNKQRQPGTTALARYETVDGRAPIFLKVTDEMAQWVVDEDTPWQPFEDAGVSFVRVDNPLEVVLDSVEA